MHEVKTQHNVELIKLPKTPEEIPQGFSFKRKVKAIKSKVAELAQVNTSCIYEGEDKNRLLRQCLAVMDIPQKNWRAADITLKYFDGVKIDNSILFRMLLKLDACADIIKQDKAVPLWYGVPDVNAYCVVSDLNLEFIKNTLIAFITIDLYTGVLAGNRQQISMPGNYIKRLVHDLGYPAYTAAAPAELFNFHFIATLGVGVSNRINAVKIYATPAQKRHNYELSKNRQNHSCKYYKACADCEIGFDICPYACHKLTIIRSKNDKTETSNTIR
jgi:hypothetical protein